MLQLVPIEDTVVGQELIQQGVQEATQESIIEVLETRLGDLPEALVQSIYQINNLSTLKLLLRQAAKADSLASFEQTVANQV